MLIWPYSNSCYLWDELEKWWQRKKIDLNIERKTYSKGKIFWFFSFGYNLLTESLVYIQILSQCMTVWDCVWGLYQSIGYLFVWKKKQESARSIFVFSENNKKQFFHLFFLFFSNSICLPLFWCVVTLTFGKTWKFELFVVCSDSVNKGLGYTPLALHSNSLSPFDSSV